MKAKKHNNNKKNYNLSLRPLKKTVQFNAISVYADVQNFNNNNKHNKSIILHKNPACHTLIVKILDFAFIRTHIHRTMHFSLKSFSFHQSL